jgi:hypothetical protein
MVTADAVSYINYLRALALLLRPPRFSSSGIDQSSFGLLWCDWLELNRIDLGGEARQLLLGCEDRARSWWRPGWEPESMEDLTATA